METETLARKLGTTTHFSPLLRKARRSGLGTTGSLLHLAVRRGCRYYDSSGILSRLADEPAEYQAQQMPRTDEFNNEDLAMELLSIVLPNSQWRLRLGAAMLASQGNSPESLARLAIHERLERW